MEKSTASRKTSPGEKSAASTASRALRQSTLNQARRSLILDAARAAFSELGLEGASLREIAKRAGYTPGAIYSHFASLEEIYGALLSESLQRLNQVVAAATGGGGSATAIDLLRAKAGAFYAFYRDNPKELDLGFYLFDGMKPRGLTPELNHALNEQLMAALRPVQLQLEASGLSTEAARIETSAVFAHIVGVLVLHNTGRIRLFNQTPDQLFGRYMDSLIRRLPPASASVSAIQGAGQQSA